MNEMLPVDGPQSKYISMESAINNQFIISRKISYINDISKLHAKKFIPLKGSNSFF